MNGKRPVRYNHRFSSQRNYRHNQIPKEPPPKKPSKKLFWTLGIIFIIIAIGVASLFLFFPGERTEESLPSNTDSEIRGVICEEDWNCTDWSDCVGGNKTRICIDLNNCGTEENKSDEENVCEMQTIDCGTNESCFLNYVETCSPANLTIIQSEDNAGTVLESTSVATVERTEGNNCIMTFKCIQFDLVYNGLPLDYGYEGKSMECKIPKSDIENYKAYFGSKEKMEQSCSGPLYDLMIQLPEAQAQTIACGSWGCFIFYASENCDLTSYTNTSTINLFGLDITTTTYYEISGKQDNNCIFKIRTEEQHVNYTDELVQQMLDGGATQEEIDQQELESNIISDILEGKEGVCEFIPSNLKSLLENWEAGNFLSSDWELAESCEGEYFSLEL